MITTFLSAGVSESYHEIAGIILYDSPEIPNL